MSITYVRVGLLHQFLDPKPFNPPKLRATKIRYTFILHDIDGNMVSAFGGYSDSYTQINPENVNDDSHLEQLYPWAE